MRYIAHVGQVYALKPLLAEPAAEGKTVLLLNHALDALKKSMTEVITVDMTMHWRTKNEQRLVEE